METYFVFSTLNAKGSNKYYMEDGFETLTQAREAIASLRKLDPKGFYAYHIFLSRNWDDKPTSVPVGGV